MEQEIKKIRECNYRCNRDLKKRNLGTSFYQKFENNSLEKCNLLYCFKKKQQS